MWKLDLLTLLIRGKYMNTDEWKSLIVKLLIVALTPLATKFGIDGNTTAAVAAWIGTGVVLAYGIYDHWNMKKVPEAAKVLAIILAIGALAWIPMGALAADMATKAASAWSVAPCTQNECSGLYAGGELFESGGGLTVGSGTSASVTDLAMGGHVGAQFWNGQWFIAGEAGADYGLMQNGTVPGGGNSALWDVYGLAKIGYSLSSIFGVGSSSAPTQQAPTLPSSLAGALMAPYAIIGVWDRPWGIGFASGAGVEALLAKQWTLSVDYIHVSYNNAQINPIVTQQSEDLVRAAVDYHF